MEVVHSGKGIYGNRSPNAKAFRTNWVLWYPVGYKNYKQTSAVAASAIKYLIIP